MGDKVLSIVGRRKDDEAGEDAAECLKVWLKRVESGEITSVAVVGVGPGRTEYGHSHWVDGRLIGAVAILQQELIALLKDE